MLSLTENASWLLKTHKKNDWYSSFFFTCNIYLDLPAYLNNSFAYSCFFILFIPSRFIFSYLVVLFVSYYISSKFLSAQMSKISNLLRLVKDILSNFRNLDSQLCFSAHQKYYFIVFQHLLLLMRSLFFSVFLPSLYRNLPFFLLAYGFSLCPCRMLASKIVAE